jgi:DNA-binding NarL/FixJ family response regulator
MKRILIVDDHHSVTESCRRLFGDLGANVLTASNPIKGYHIYVTQQPDIAIVDLKLGSDPVAGLSLIRLMRVHSAAVVIVALSMDDDQATRQDALNAGATAFVSKDAPMAELLHACEFWQQKRVAYGGGK